MPTTPPTITALPAPPDPNDRSTFNTRAYPWSVAQQTLATEVGNVATNVYNNAVETASNAAAAADSVTDADSAAASAAASAASAINAPGTQATSTTSLLIGTGAKSFTLAQTGKAFAVGQSVVIASTAAPSTNQMIGAISSFNAGTGAMVVDVTTIKGSGTYANWTISLGMAASSAPASLTIDARTSNTALTPGDSGKLILASGSWTQTFNAVATLGAGWNIEFQNAGNGAIVLDPNASELIDGQTTYTLPAGWLVRLQCDGTKITVTVLRRRVYGAPVLVTATGTYTVPPDTYVLRAYAVGRGGNGTSSPATGGGGGMAYGDIAVTPGQTINWDITSGVAKVVVGGVDMLTGNSASGTTAGTASKHASVTNGGAYSGGAGMASAGGGASSGSPMGTGVSSASGQNGGCGWGGAGVNNNGGGAGAAAPAGGRSGGISPSASFPNSEPLLALLNGAPGVVGANVLHGGNGGPGAGGGGNNSASFEAGTGGFGAGGGGNPSGQAGAGGFGAGGSRGGTAGTGGAPGYGGGAPDGGSIFGGAAAIIYFTGA